MMFIQYLTKEKQDWIKKRWHIYTMGFYSGIKKNEIMSFAGKLIELEKIMPDLESQRV